MGKEKSLNQIYQEYYRSPGDLGEIRLIFLGQVRELVESKREDYPEDLISDEDAAEIINEIIGILTACTIPPSNFGRQMSRALDAAFRRKKSPREAVKNLLIEAMNEDKESEIPDFVDTERVLHIINTTKKISDLQRQIILFTLEGKEASRIALKVQSFFENAPTRSTINGLFEDAMKQVKNEYIYYINDQSNRL